MDKITSRVYIISGLEMLGIGSLFGIFGVMSIR